MRLWFSHQIHSKLSENVSFWKTCFACNNAKWDAYCVNLVIFCEGSQVWILTLLHNPIKGLKEAFFLPRIGTRVHGTSQQTSKEFVDTFLVPWLSLESSRGYSQGDNRIVSVTRKYILHPPQLSWSARWFLTQENQRITVERESW